MLWFKALHLFFMVAWFAGIFYLPRLFVYHAETNSDEVKQQLSIMERRLFWFVTPFAILTLVFGVALIGSYGMAWFAVSGWLHVKLALVVLLYAYHGYLYVLMGDLHKQVNVRSPRFYRFFNEAPVILLLVIILLAVLKPF